MLCFKQIFTKLTFLLKHSFAEVIKMIRSLSQSNKLLLSEVVKIMKLLLVMPATNAVSERSFSALKRIKTYLRSTTTANRMNNLMVLHIHKNITDSLDLNKAGNEFVSRGISVTEYL